MNREQERPGPMAWIAGLPSNAPQDWPTCMCGHSAAEHETILDEGDPLRDSERCTVEGCPCPGLRDALPGTGKRTTE